MTSYLFCLLCLLSSDSESLAPEPWMFFVNFSIWILAPAYFYEPSSWPYSPNGHLDLKNMFVISELIISMNFLFSKISFILLGGPISSAGSTRFGSSKRLKKSQSRMIFKTKGLSSSFSSGRISSSLDKLLSPIDLLIYNSFWDSFSITF